MSQASPKPQASLMPGNATARAISMAFEAAPDAMIISSPARRITAANAAARRMFEYTGAEFTGLALRTLYGPDEDWEKVQRALADQSTLPCAAALRHKSGRLFDAEVSAAPVFDDVGRMSGAVETIRTVASAPAQPALRSAHHANAPAVRLARGMAHDFNNLLAIITGNVQLACRRVTDPAMHDYLQEAEQACAMGAQLTRRLMSVAEDRHYRPTGIDIAQLLKAQRPLFQRALGQEVTLRFRVAKNIRPAFADSSAFENALLNLVLNARDAMPCGGALTIAVNSTRISSSDSNAEITSGLKPGDYVCVTVTDTGTGMPPSVAARAFDPFFTTKPPGRGTGLGLASVYGFAQQSGGGATLTSSPGTGTSVALFIPASLNDSR